MSCKSTISSFYIHFVPDWPGHHTAAITFIFNELEEHHRDQHIFRAELLTRKTFLYRSLWVRGVKAILFVHFPIGNHWILYRKINENECFGTLYSERPVEKSFTSWDLSSEYVCVADVPSNSSKNEGSNDPVVAGPVRNEVFVKWRNCVF